MIFIRIVFFASERDKLGAPAPQIYVFDGKNLPAAWLINRGKAAPYFYFIIYFSEAIGCMGLIKILYRQRIETYYASSFIAR